MFTIDMKDKVAFVTGGGRGIGLAITEALAAAGATVVITYTSKDPSDIAKKLGEKYGVKIHVYKCPGEDSKVVDEVVERVSKEVGEVDYVICNAGVSLWRELVDMPDSELHDLMGVNLYAPLHLSRAFARHWLGLPAHVGSSAESEANKSSRPAKLDLKKKVLFVSSISGFVNMTPQYQVAYHASKAGLTMAAKTLAGEWARWGIAVNAISPGYVETDMIANPPPGEAESWVKKWKEMTPVDRFAKPQEIGEMVVLMMCDKASSFMTGHDLVMDGGYTTY